MDIFSTILDITGCVEVDTGPVVPSRSLLPILNEFSDNWGEDAVYSEQEETRVVRTQKYAFFKNCKYK